MSRPLVALRDVPSVDYESAFLIADLLTSSITYLSGEPKAGKSLLAAGMVAALTDGSDTFLGLKVLRQLDSIVYAFTDEGADSELKARLAGTEAFERVQAVGMYAASAEDWRDLTSDLLKAKPGLFVIDTVIGSLPIEMEISQGSTATWLTNQLRPIAAAGIPVLAITHTPKGPAEGLSTSSSVMGGRAMAAGARGVIALRKSRQGGLRVHTSINRATTDLDLDVSVARAAGRETPLWSVGKDKGVDTPKITSGVEAFLAWVEETEPQEANANALANRYFDETTSAPSTTRAWIGKHLIHEAGAWIRVPTQVAHAA